MSRKKDYTRIFERIAKEHDTTIEKVRREIEFAIQVGLHNPDPEIQALWAKIPRKGDVPTPDELITYIVRQAKEEGADVLLRRHLMWQDL